MLFCSCFILTIILLRIQKKECINVANYCMDKSEAASTLSLISDEGHLLQNSAYALIVQRSEFIAVFLEITEFVGS